MSGEGEGRVFNLSMQVTWMFSGMKYPLLLYCCDDMQTKVYSSATIKNYMCAHIGTPRYWLLLDDLKWETWKNGYCYHKCVKNVWRRIWCCK